MHILIERHSHHHPTRLLGFPVQESHQYVNAVGLDEVSADALGIVFH